jgi:hypothetical protein
MDWKCSIRLVGSGGGPLRDFKVNVVTSGWLGEHLSNRTNSDGWAHFSMRSSSERVLTKYIYVDLSMHKTKKLQDECFIDSGETLSFTVTDDDFR